MTENEKETNLVFSKYLQTQEKLEAATMSLLEVQAKYNTLYAGHGEICEAKDKEIAKLVEEKNNVASERSHYYQAWQDSRNQVADMQAQVKKLISTNNDLTQHNLGLEREMHIQAGYIDRVQELDPADVSERRQPKMKNGMQSNFTSVIYNGETYATNIRR